jgi:ElaB/YqjD/DUF883 family membrane-anchored ribosome-binding protein
MTTQSTVHPEVNVPPNRTPFPDARSAPEASGSGIAEAKAKLRHMVETGKERVTEWQGGIQEGIRGRPIQSVLIAAAVGAVIGVLVGRRSR